MDYKEFKLEQKKHRLLRISSEDKSNVNDSNSKFSVDIPPTGKAIDNVCGFSLKFALCPNIFFNVPSYKNELQITKQTGNVVYTIFIAPNQYNITDFLARLKSQIDAFIFPDTASVALDPFGKIVFSWTGDSYAFTEANYEASTMRDIIGLTRSDAQGTFFTAQNMSAPVNLTGESEVYIHSRALHQSGLTEASGNFSVVDVIPLNNTPYGGVASITYPDHQLTKINYCPYETLKSLRTIDIVLRDRRGNILELPDNYYFTMMVKLYHE
jgi:hypothetical protein